MSKRLPYTSQELTEAVDRLERLHRLHEKTYANYRATQEETSKAVFKASYDRLTRNIETGERRLQYMQDAVEKAEATR